MFLLSYWERLLSFGFNYDNNSEDSRDYYNYCACLINAGLGP